MTAGNRLFYHVVEDDRVAMKLLKWVNQKNLAGDVNFFPLKRLVTKPRKDFQDAVCVLCWEHAVQDGRPIIEILEYNPRYEPVMRLVFGGTAIVRNMVAGSRISRAEGVDCVTMEGDQVCFSETWNVGLRSAAAVPSPEVTWM